MMKFKCAHCGKATDRPAGHVNRSRARGLRLFCGRKCAGLAHRKGKTKAQRVEEKRLYDIAYRAKNLTRILARKKAYHKRTYDPVKAAAHRQTQMPYHVQYCRQPWYHEWKRDYDRRRRAGEFGAFADAYTLTLELTREVKRRDEDGQVKYQNGGTNKAQRRKRQAGQSERGRNSRRSGASNSATHGW
jgi:hypothetical protein